MALVDYSSSDGHEDEDEDKDEDQVENDLKNATLKRKREELPPLPSNFHDLYASTTRLSTRDDPALHGGRKRVTPHVEGNWPTHLYIEWFPLTTENGSLSGLIANLKELTASETTLINSFLVSDLGAPLPLHISISRPIGFSTEVKDGFVASLECTIRSSGVRPFNITFSGLDWVPNYEKTRWFLVLRLKQPELDGLNKLLHSSNRIVHEYDQPTLYATLPPKASKKPRRKGSQSQFARRDSGTGLDWSSMQDVSDAFHISIAWTLEQPSFELLARTKSLFADGFEDVKKISFDVEEMKVKVGNVVTNIPLPKKVVEEKALWGT